MYAYISGAVLNITDRFGYEPSAGVAALWLAKNISPIEFGGQYHSLTTQVRLLLVIFVEAQQAAPLMATLFAIRLQGERFGDSCEITYIPTISLDGKPYLGALPATRTV